MKKAFYFSAYSGIIAIILNNILVLFPFFFPDGFFGFFRVAFFILSIISIFSLFYFYFSFFKLAKVIKNSFLKNTTIFFLPFLLILNIIYLTIIYNPLLEGKLQIFLIIFTIATGVVAFLFGFSLKRSSYNLGNNIKVMGNLMIISGILNMTLFFSILGGIFFLFASIYGVLVLFEQSKLIN